MWIELFSEIRALSHFLVDCINVNLEFFQRHMLFTDDGAGIEAALDQQEKEAVAGTSTAVQPMDIDTPIRDDGFGGHLGQDMICKDCTDYFSCLCMYYKTMFHD